MSTATLRAITPHLVVCVPFFPYSTYGLSLWSSSEDSQGGARSLNTYSGHVDYINKGNYGTYRRVRAFLSLSTYGSNLWSSSEVSQTTAKDLYMNSGHIFYYGKGHGYTIRRVRAFLSLNASAFS